MHPIYDKEVDGNAEHRGGEQQCGANVDFGMSREQRAVDYSSSAARALRSARCWTAYSKSKRDRQTTSP
eukprot:6180126-Pleurochrysis_carterae.AAC.3